MIAPLDDITGKKFGHWLVLARVDNNPTIKHSRWMCRCDCGKEKTVVRNSLLYGYSLSCGCRRREAQMDAMRRRREIAAAEEQPTLRFNPAARFVNPADRRASR